MGLTTLFLLAGERLNLDVALVRAPDHVFPRICSQGKCVNVEMLKSGALQTDAFYVENLLIPKEALERGVYLRSLKSPTEVSASLFLGLGYVAAQKQPDVAEVLYEKAIAKAPGFADPYSNLAALDAIQGHLPEAMAHLEKALALNPLHYPSAINLGVLHHQQGRFTAAVQAYERAIRINPLAVQAYRRRSKASLSLGDERGALLDLEKILVVQPRFCDVREEAEHLRKKLNVKVKAADPTSLAELRASGRCLSLAP